MRLTPARTSSCQLEWDSVFEKKQPRLRVRPRRPDTKVTLIPRIFSVSRLKLIPPRLVSQSFSTHTTLLFCDLGLNNQCCSIDDAYLGLRIPFSLQVLHYLTFITKPQYHILLQASSYSTLGSTYTSRPNYTTQLISPFHSFGLYSPANRILPALLLFCFCPVISSFLVLGRSSLQHFSRTPLSKRLHTQ